MKHPWFAILSLILLVCFPTLSFGPVEAGHGGDLITCRESAENPLAGLLSLDYVATYRKSSGNADIVGAKSVKESLSRIAGILHNKAPALSRGFDEFVSLIRNTDDASKPRLWEEASFGLVPLQDQELLNLVPDNCKKSEGNADIIQAVVRQKVFPDSSGPIIYKFIPAVFDELAVHSPLQASFLLVHEYLWDVSSNVDRNRQVVRFLHSDAADRMTAAEFQAQLRGYGIDPSGPPSIAESATWAKSGERVCLKSDTTSACWGSGYTSQLNASSGALFLNRPEITHVAMGYQHVCVATKAAVECVDAQMPFLSQAPVLQGVSALVAGRFHTCAIQNEKVSCWGDYVPVQMPSGLTAVHAISAKEATTCVLRDDNTLGKMVCWGEPLGKDKEPRVFNKGTVLSAISVGGTHVCGLSKGIVDCWGANRKGQSDVPAISGVVAVAALKTATCAISKDNLYCWGEDAGWSGPRPHFKNAHSIVAGEGIACVWDDTGVGCWELGGRDLSDKIPPELRRK